MHIRTYAESIVEQVFEDNRGYYWEFEGQALALMVAQLRAHLECDDATVTAWEDLRRPEPKYTSATPWNILDMMRNAVEEVLTDEVFLPEARKVEDRFGILGHDDYDEV